jgi:hypothetical protein
MEKTPEFSDLLGKTITKIENINYKELIFHTEDKVYILYHEKDCCEDVEIESITGDLEDLIGSPILMAEESGGEHQPTKPEDYCNFEQWTFYKLATIKGYVDIRWHGTDDGYYSLDVSFREIERKNQEEEKRDGRG